MNFKCQYIFHYNCITMPEIRDITENTKGNAFLTAEAAFYLGCMKQQEFDRYHRRKGAR